MGCLWVHGVVVQPVVVPWPAGCFRQGSRGSESQAPEVAQGCLEEALLKLWLAGQKKNPTDFLAAAVPEHEV